MILFITSMVLLIIGVLWLIVAPKTISSQYDEDDVYPFKIYGVIPVVVSVILLVLASFTTVQAKQVGVKTTFGRVSEETLSSGANFKLPWQKVTEIDATVQTDEYHGDSCITVVLADKNTACVSATNRWSVNRENAATVFSDFRSEDPTESLRDAVVSTQLKAAVNDVFGSYDATQEEKPDYKGMAAEIQKMMAEATNGLVDIESVTISYIRPSEKLQAKIESIQAQEAKTRIAEEALATARKQAEANKALSDSISNDPNVLVAQCIEGLMEGSIKNQPGFSCWPGGGSGVVIPGTPSQ